ncbi:hypothetical protein GCM10012280_66790 [Wenjunlia tyrosinilytica]|uniref:Uncharacterized protein n=1 Tax=Wenjunlia tyrosinilytica TaxID=1544741 RepID=A0A917ZYV7_9ACTN|nr:hypothetical protein GCM10012280_66790 [Wenjunlia tyrosinilytica]
MYGTPLLVPPGVTTVTLTVPEPAGAAVVIWVALTGVNDTDVAPNLTVVAPVKSVPVIVTGVPPAFEPPLGLRLVMTGTMAHSFWLTHAVPRLTRCRPGHGGGPPLGRGIRRR